MMTNPDKSLLSFSKRASNCFYHRSAMLAFFITKVPCAKECTPKIHRNYYILKHIFILLELCDYGDYCDLCNIGLTNESGPHMHFIVNDRFQLV